METKTCTRCGEVKATEDFFRDVSRSDGLTGRCKPCHKEDANRYRQKESFKVAAAKRSAKWRAAHPVAVAEAAARDKEKTAERVRQWRTKNKDKVSAQSLRRRSKQKAYYKKQADEITDNYVVQSLHMPKELAPLVRAKLQIYRATKQLLQTIKEKQNERN